MRKVIKQGVKMKRMTCECCGQIELISIEESLFCSNCGEPMKESSVLTEKMFAEAFDLEPEKIIAKEPPLSIGKPAEQKEEISGPGPGPGKPVKKEDNRTCASCMHCAGKAGHGRGMQYRCGLSDAWFLTGLGCDAWRDR